MEDGIVVGVGPERGYVVPGCGKGRDQDRTLVLMSLRRRPGTGGRVQKVELHEWDME